MVEEILHDSTVDEPGNVYSKNVNVYSLWILMANPAMDLSGMGARRKDGLQGPNTKRASQGVTVSGWRQWTVCVACESVTNHGFLFFGYQVSEYTFHFDHQNNQMNGIVLVL